MVFLIIMLPLIYILIYINLKIKLRSMSMPMSTSMPKFHICLKDTNINKSIISSVTSRACKFRIGSVKI